MDPRTHDDQIIGATRSGQNSMNFGARPSRLQIAVICLRNRSCWQLEAVTQHHTFPASTGSNQLDREERKNRHPQADERTSPNGKCVSFNAPVCMCDYCVSTLWYVCVCARAQIARAIYMVAATPMDQKQYSS
jgi:hypothetical protein